MGFSLVIRGPSWLSPIVPPRASAEVSVRNPQRLTLTDGTFFLPGCYVVPWGRASATASVAPEALQERGCSCKVFSQRLSVCEVLVSADIGGVSAGLGGAMRTHRHPSAFSARPGSVVMRRAPEPGPTQGDLGELSVLFVCPIRRPSAGQRGEASTTPIARVANRGFLIELLSGDSSGCPCPVL
jgi:hypothetical protein